MLGQIKIPWLTTSINSATTPFGRHNEIDIDCNICAQTGTGVDQPPVQSDPALGLVVAEAHETANKLVLYFKMIVISSIFMHIHFIISVVHVLRILYILFLTADSEEEDGRRVRVAFPAEGLSRSQSTPGRLPVVAGLLPLLYIKLPSYQLVDLRYRQLSGYFTVFSEISNRFAKMDDCQANPACLGTGSIDFSKCLTKIPDRPNFSMHCRQQVGVRRTP